MHAAGGTCSRRARDQRILQPLVIPLAMIVLDELTQGTAEMALAHRNHPIEAFFFDRSNEALRVRVGVRCPYGRLHDVDPRIAQRVAHVLTPFPIAITDQHAMLAQQADVSRRHRATDLSHEEIIGMRRRAHDMHAARGQVDDEHGVVRHQAAPRPDLCREEIRARDRTPVRPQERLPRGRPLRDRRHARALSGCARSSNGRRDARRFSTRLEFACSPRWILPRHAHHQPPDLGEHAAPTRPGRRVRPFPCDQLPMPAEQRVGRDDRGDLAQRPTAQPKRSTASAAGRHRSNADAAHPAAGARGGFLRSGRRAPPARGARASRSGPATASGEPRGRSRAGAYITAGDIRRSQQVDRSVGHNTLRNPFLLVMDHFEFAFRTATEIVLPIGEKASNAGSETGAGRV